MATIEVLGSCCRRCESLLASAQQAALACGVAYRVEKITDVARMRDLNVSALPALVIDGRIISMGTVPTPEEILRHL